MKLVTTSKVPDQVARYASEIATREFLRPSAVIQRDAPIPNRGISSPRPVQVNPAQGGARAPITKNPASHSGKRARGRFPSQLKHRTHNE